MYIIEIINNGIGSMWPLHTCTQLITLFIHFKLDMFYVIKQYGNREREREKLRLLTNEIIITIATLVVHKKSI